MHELAITQSLVSAVWERVGTSRVTRVHVTIGRLSGVVPDAVRFCFDVCAAGTPLEGAALDVDEIPGRARCRACGVEENLADAIALCRCGSADLEFVAGRELRLDEVEVI